ncbi:nucleotidyltransferase family protein [Terrilactibacillus sp. S3-3]|nr:nucleotidyltransferase family protein [Terrilactibacillus sp. S3-3]
MDRFEALGIEVIPLKGVFFAEKYFGHIGARATTDIDLLVKPEQIEEAVKCVKEMGFTDEEKYPSFHYHYVFCKKIFGLSKNIKVEIHQHVLRSKTSELNINSFWEKAIPLKNYKFVKELSNFHTFYYICLHGWKHKLNSIKYFIDIEVEPV